jgi:membrane-bound ClpP family serine protease
MKFFNSFANLKIHKMKTTFGKQNYQLFIAGIVLIILGYLLMIGGGSEDPNVFNPAIFDTQRITIAPMVCLLGFITIIAAIMWRPKTKNEEA